MGNQLDSGYIKLYRGMLNWEWYDDPNTFKLFVHLLLTVNYYDKKWHGIEIKRGSRLTSYRKLSEETKMSVKSVRVALNHLIGAQCVAQSSTSKYTVVTVLNYDFYQEGAQSGASKGHSEGTVRAQWGQQIKKDKNIKNIKKDKKEREEPLRTPHGTYQNVFLSEQEFSDLQRDYPDADQKIERLSEYMASSGRTYADHCATIRKWAKEDSRKGKRDTEHSRSYDLEEFERMIELPPVLED